MLCFLVLCDGIHSSYTMGVIIYKGCLESVEWNGRMEHWNGLLITENLSN